ncbi:unnamed protein product [Rotaria magnacalcarata]|uniref:Tetratricopeptide repeat protein n=1 Tax=Rotaria magnacalcarata TaxID=392030 RepID=A0A818WK51_9BILA|nr:unnamed protein product [Rotaria magnacalcarata]CAF1918006.1 unnamed protein product [Rotaria magnacalcarata]CAF1986724.1 unnamed protein product [Rotaria magnacalcarata]CAF2134407.1 unnamed protein product [Rotaria magnacalcarata]CAF3727185.1 unnamed protein product [Rotaria magnacalcarata]
MFEKTLEIHLAAQLPKHPEIAQSYNNLANVLGTLALRIYREVYQPGNSRIASSLFNIGLAYCRENRNEISLNYMQQAFDIQLQVLSHGDEEIENMQEKIISIKQN